MHSHTNVKFVNVKQAKEIYQRRNTKEKLYKTNAEFHPGPPGPKKPTVFGLEVNYYFRQDTVLYKDVRL